MANFFSKIFFSVFMDKSARETMERRQEAKRKLNSPELFAEKKDTDKPIQQPPKPQPTAAVPRHQRPLKGVTQEEEQVAALLAQKIASAEDSIADRVLKKKSMSGERGELIMNALRIQKAKSDVFNELSDEEFRKLQGLAQKMMLGGTPKGG
ncbi:MAG: hypothetical protein OQK35_02260 [Alphaproteobacteria bacterium]|nr:hypothetical protein [Rhodospirillales bacterium]MCW9045132.1 hypothetical protein [Alphaproteobacteria bacterium]